MGFRFAVVDTPGYSLSMYSSHMEDISSHPQGTLRKRECPWILFLGKDVTFLTEAQEIPDFYPPFTSKPSFDPTMML